MNILGRSLLGAQEKRRKKIHQLQSIHLLKNITSSQPLSPVTMSHHCERASKPIIQCIRSSYARASLLTFQPQTTRGFQSSALAREEATQPFYKAPDPTLVSSPRLEKRLMKHGITPVGSRRRRAALQDSTNIPFEQLPFQCFQEARKILLVDRREKLQQIESVKNKITRVQALPVDDIKGEQWKKSRVKPMQLYLDRLKVLADINDPLVKKRFEDGQGSYSLFFFLMSTSPF